MDSLIKIGASVNIESTDGEYIHIVYRMNGLTRISLRKMCKCDFTAFPIVCMREFFMCKFKRIAWNEAKYSDWNEHIWNFRKW